MVGPLIRDQRARRELICAGLSRGHISDGLVPRTVEQPSVGEPIQQLLGGRLTASLKVLAELRTHLRPGMVPTGTIRLHDPDRRRA